MATLDYQHGGDAFREKRADWRRRIFGVSRIEVWKALAGEIHARVEPRGWWRSDRVIADVGPWQLTLDTYTVSSGQSHQVFTRLRAPFVNDGFRFRVYRKSIFSGLGKKLFGMQDIEIGEPFFDDDFIIQSNDEAGVRMLLRDARLRQLIAVQPRIMFEVKDDEGYFGPHFPQGVDELRFSAVGLIRDVNLLKQLFDLFAETLHRLCDIGAARDQRPGVQL